MSKYIIYALQDPFTFEIRYIGKSCSGLKRIKRHFNFNEQKNDKNKHKVNWINSLTRLPNILIIQTLNSNKELIQAECYWIDYFNDNNLLPHLDACKTTRKKCNICAESRRWRPHGNA